MNILVLTSVYKDPNPQKYDTATNIVNLFVHKWADMGHKVIVIHNSHMYPSFIHKTSVKFRKLLEARLGFWIADYEVMCERKFFDENVKVYRLPIKKYIPHQSPSSKVIDKQVNRIVEVLGNEEFVPDVITGHWASPQMEIIAQLKKIYNCKTAIVLHGTGYIDNPKFNAQKYMPFIDKIGGRSVNQAKQIKKILDLKDEPFVCYSGVPDEYVKKYQLNLSKFENLKKWKFAYVGRLVAYKKIDAIIKALAKIKDVEWEFNIVGDGAERGQLEALAKLLNVEDKVHFLGRVTREKVMEILSETHCFIMISINEVFGLAYLEAMAASCITIASKYGGVDGIIIDGQNGFLCQAGSVDNLFNILKKIMANNLCSEIANQGYLTANCFSDSKVAEIYLDCIDKSKNEFEV